MKTIIIKIDNITLKKYTNGSYSYAQENPPRDRNIPNELAKKIIDLRVKLTKLV